MVRTNSNTVTDLTTMANWDGASNTTRSLAVIGSFGITATVEQSTARSANVQFQASNPMTLGSGLGFLGDENRAYFNSLVHSGRSFAENQPEVHVE